MRVVISGIVLTAFALGPVPAEAAGERMAMPQDDGLGLAGGARDDAIRCMATAISYEAGHEPEAGQRASEPSQVKVNWQPVRRAEP